MTSILNISTQHTSLRSKKSVSELDETIVPDSTTIVEKDKLEFAPGQDVLLKQKDGRFYLGTVVEVDAIREQCLVKFGDNTDSWSSYKDLTKLSTPEQEDLCVVCKKSAPKNKHEITVCDKCGRGYHQKCHQPEIPAICQKEGSNWMCKRCIAQEPIRQRKTSDYKILRRDSIRKLCSNVDSSSIMEIRSDVKTLPYNMEALSWDTYHRVNMEQIYCYCGGNGEWYTQMLQCGRCRQWFHDKCVSCLQYPLYCGDRFYVFVCSICNHGKEFLRRLELKWVDLVHLMLFNLTAYNSKKYYDLDTIVIPYINDNWHALQLPPKIFNVSKSERRENILSVLTNNRNRFKCGREIKKRTTIWGLRIRLPPPAPCVTLPPVGSISEDELKERWQGNRRLQFLPLEESACSHGEGTLTKIVVLDNHMLNVMMGIAYQENSALSETESPCPSPDGEHEDHLDNKLYKVEYGGGCAKRSVPFPKISLKHKKRLLALNVRTRDKILRRQRRKGKDEVKKRKSNMEYHRPKRLSLDSKSTKNRETLPLTPPTSVSAPPTPPASGSSSLGPDIATEFTESSNTLLSQNLCILGKHPAKLTKSNLTKNNLDTNLNELNTPCDTSGDETSSKSTLDLIIPPPKDFEGKNNPFLALMRGNVEHLKKRSKDAITLPLPLTAVIPGRPVIRPMKRQLSEKDICIGPNGEVKRRRLRRNRSNQLPIFTNSLQTASKTATVVPVRPDAKEWGQRNLRSTLNQNTSPQSQIGNCVDYALNGRRLRQRQDKSQEKEKISNPPTPKPSPVKQEPDISMDDLKSSVNSYFGAAMRIAAGERFSIKAKRIGPSGKTEYLIEWEGSSNGMT
ncbi:Polycomb-like MTF2 factor 2 [Popillia japonica]|uniref:Polycomb-like MTF2 factor 2 n=1 Tax=Popillia japonica TaxID=7064 RepID=A0AAW1JUW6_POPJA